MKRIRIIGAYAAIFSIMMFTANTSFAAWNFRSCRCQTACAPCAPAKIVPACSSACNAAVDAAPAPADATEAAPAEETKVDQTLPVPEDAKNAVENAVDSPAEENAAAPAPAAEETPAAIEDDAPAAEEAPAAIEDDAPAAEEAPAAIEDDAPAAEEAPAAIEDDAPAADADDDAPAAADDDDAADLFNDDADDAPAAEEKAAPADEKKADEKKAEEPAASDEDKDDLFSSIQTWTDSTGKYSIEARFVEKTSAGIVRLEKADGTMMRIPFDRLSNGDQMTIMQNLSSVAAQ